MCLGKALTGGYMTMAATLCTDRVAHGITSGEAGVLMHGPTYMANPLAAAVASASIDLLLSRDWRDEVDTIEATLTSELDGAAAFPGWRTSASSARSGWWRRGSRWTSRPSRRPPWRTASGSAPSAS